MNNTPNNAKSAPENPKSTPKVRPWKEILASVQDQLPQKKLPERSGTEPPHGPRPWAEIRSEFVLQIQPPMLRMPMPGFFLGAGFLGSSKYLLWRGKRLTELYSSIHKNGPRSYQEWIRCAYNLITNEEGDFGMDGYTMMYYMLIEPFALMDLTAPAPESEPEHPARNDTSGSLKKGG